MSRHWSIHTRTSPDNPRSKLIRPSSQIPPTSKPSNSHHLQLYHAPRHDVPATLSCRRCSPCRRAPCRPHLLDLVHPLYVARSPGRKGENYDDGSSRNREKRANAIVNQTRLPRTPARPMSRLLPSPAPPRRRSAPTRPSPVRSPPTPPTNPDPISIIDGRAIEEKGNTKLTRGE